MKTLKKNFFFILFAASLFVSLILYHSSISFYFFQDDFFEIGSAKANNIMEYISFFQFRPDIVDWRPISQLNYFFFLKKVFGLNPTVYRFFSFILFFATAFLIAKSAKYITKNQNVGLLTASFWLTSSIHFTNLTWISASYIMIGTFFFMLTTFLFIKRRYFFAIFSFFMSIGSFEFAITWPVFMGVYYFWMLKNSAKQTIVKFFPYIVISSAYLIARLLFMHVPKIPEYTIAVNFESAKAFFWYILWTFNIPEEFKKQITNNLIVFNKKFALEYSVLIIVTFASAAIVVLTGIIIPVIRTLQKKMSPDIKLIAYCLFWFTATISPVLIIPNHTFIMYLALCSIGMYMLLSYLLISIAKKEIILIVFFIWTIGSIFTLNFYKNNFWMVNAQKFAKQFAINIQNEFPKLPPNSVVYYPLNDTRAIQALQKEDAIKLLLDDQTISIYYNKEELIGDLENLKIRPIYLYNNQ